MMKRAFYDLEQGSEPWFELRKGLVTASMFHAVMAKGEGKTRRSYMLSLIGERLTGQCAESYENQHMIRGRELEDEARQLYTLVTGNKANQIGFIKLGDDIGASPDGLINEDGCLEIKTKLPKLQLDCLFRDQVPAEHMKQIQGQLWISDREWCDYMSYSPGLKPFIKRVYPDRNLIYKITLAVEGFLEEMKRYLEAYSRI